MGFSRETFQFLSDLEAHNSKDWFEANRDRYEAHWKGAALDFIAEVSERMASLSPALKAVPKLNGSLRRINRDVRFSKDKSPYSARLHMVFWAGDHPNRSPGMHIVLNSGGVGYGAGQWAFDSAALAALRARIAGVDGDALIAALEQAGSVGCRMREPDLARLPKGFEAEGRRAELLRYKGFVVRTHDKDASKGVLIGKGAADWALETTGAILPVLRWLHPN